MSGLFADVSATGDGTFRTVTMRAGSSLPVWDGSLATIIGAQCNGTGIPVGNTIAGITDGTHFTLAQDCGAARTNVQVIIAQQWAAAQGLWQQNLAGDGTAASAGYFGSDGATSIDLAPAGKSRVLWLNADTYWAKQGGITRTSKQMIFLHNCTAIQTQSYDLSAATLQFRSGGPGENLGPLPAFDGFGPNYYLWPFGGICLGPGSLLIVCMQISGAGFGVQLARLCFLWATQFDTIGTEFWNYQVIPHPFVDGSINPGNAFLDAGDGYVYSFGYGLNSALNVGTGQDRNLSMIRWPKSDLLQSPPNLFRPQWWCGPLGWMDKAPSGRLPDLRQAAVPIFKANVPFLVLPDNNGSIHKKADGTFARVNSALGVQNAGAYVTSTAGIADLQPNRGLLAFQPPNNANFNQFTYGAKAHPEQTWAGKGTDEVLLTINTNLLAQNATLQATVSGAGGFGTTVTVTGPLPPWSIKVGDAIGSQFFGSGFLIPPNTVVASVTSPTVFTTNNNIVTGPYPAMKVTQTAEANPSLDDTSYWPLFVRCSRW